MRRLKLVVIGNGMGSVRFLETLVAGGEHGYGITVLGDEPDPGYNRIMLSPLLAGEIPFSETVLRSRQWYEENEITLHTGSDFRVVSIDRLQRLVVTAAGESFSYDHLVLATGSHAYIPDIPGSSFEGVVPFRRYGDVEAMLSAAESGKAVRRAVVIGGGLLGLEAANALNSRGMQVTLVHSQSVLLNRQLDAYAGQLLQDELESRGIAFLKPKRTACIEGCDGRASGVGFSDGSSIDAELVVFAIGIRPNTLLAAESGLACEHGIMVDDRMLTSDPSISAIGECIQHGNETFGLVEPVYLQAVTLARRLQGELQPFVSRPSATKLKVSGVQLFSSGQFQGEGRDEVITLKYSDAGIYRRLVIRDNRVVGVLLYGDTSDGAWYQELLESDQDISEYRNTLLFGSQFAAVA
ncbi:NAD(P)/FAD-dependent oxidoreductase [Kistimonas asteriae]|uniref:NAD(P)/FAD-dependent oxidoreductase n=1 Tax=Kistimonas asteriae TaxID=517724 RepID=UPI001BA69A16|nr:FAD-dependent oxidoreductase [Kistimonas asteriae]